MNTANPVKSIPLKEKASQLEQQGDWEAALAIYEKLADKRPNSVFPRLRAANLLRKLGRPHEALEKVNAALLIDPHHRNALVRQADLLTQLKDHAGALGALRTARAVDPDDNRLLLRIVQRLLSMGSLDEAQTELDALLQKEPGHADALVMQGKVADAREPGGGREWFQRALNEGNGDVRAWFEMATSLTRTGNFAEALALLEQARERFPEEPRVLLRLAALEWQRGWLERALDRLTGLAVTHPDNFEYWHKQLEWRINLGDWAWAEQALQGAPFDQPQARRRMAVSRSLVAARRFDFPSAKCHLAEAMALSPASAAEHERMARYSLYTLELDEARQHLEQARRLKREAKGTSQETTARIGLGIMGRWLSEYVVNPFAVERLRQVADLPAERQPAALAEILREEPGHTPTAIQLMMRLRTLGWLDEMAEQAGTAGQWPAAIPRTVIKFWDKPDIPEDVAEIIASWAQAGDGFEVVLFDDRGARDYLKRHYEPAVLRAYMKCRTIPMKADLFRLAYLFQEGGVYSDADDFCRHPLVTLGRSESDLIIYQEELGSIGNNFLAAAPGHTVLGDALDHAVTEILEATHSDTWFTTGPGQMTRAVARQLLPWLRHLPGKSGVQWPRWTLLRRHELLAAISIHIRCSYHKKGTTSWQAAESSEVRLGVANKSELPRTGTG